MLVEPVHDRMPVILPRDEIDDWMGQGVAMEPLHEAARTPPEGCLAERAVSQLVEQREERHA